MTVLDRGVGPMTPFGAELVEGGATFRTWAPKAQDVYVATDPGATADWSRWAPDATHRLLPQGDGSWAGFVPGLSDGAPCLFWICGKGSEGFKRDPYARGWHRSLSSRTAPASFAPRTPIRGTTPTGGRPRLAISSSINSMWAFSGGLRRRGGATAHSSTWFTAWAI